MVPRVGMLSIAARTGAVLTVIAALAGCGSSAPSNATARRGFATEASAPARPGSCPATVLETLVRVAKRIYREGISSERTAVAVHAITAGLRRTASRSRPRPAQVVATIPTALKVRKRG
jgi:hypothetical protein